MGKLTSIITEDLSECFVCGSSPTAIHHALHGSYRALADKYHLIIGLCPSCHQRLHDKDTEMDRYLQSLAQEKFEEHYTDLDFKKIFGRNFKR